MQVVAVCVLFLVSAALAAPYSSGMFLRRPRSHGYGSYISPCASAGALHAIPTGYHPGPSYQLNLGPVQGYGQSHYGGYGVPHYRADDMEDNTGEEPEMMSFSETDPSMSENAPMARYVSLGSGYSGGAHALAGGLSPVAPASPGAVGVFPGANVGGCNVPLLLSCSPSIVPGRLVKTQYGSHYAPAYGAAAVHAAVGGAEAYRGVDDHHQDLSHGEHADQAEHATTVHEAAAIPDATRTQ